MRGGRRRKVRAVSYVAPVRARRSRRMRRAGGVDIFRTTGSSSSAVAFAASVVWSNVERRFLACHGARSARKDVTLSVPLAATEREPKSCIARLSGILHRTAKRNLVAGGKSEAPGRTRARTGGDHCERVAPPTRPVTQTECQGVNGLRDITWIPPPYADRAFPIASFDWDSDS